MVMVRRALATTAVGGYDDALPEQGVDVRTVRDRRAMPPGGGQGAETGQNFARSVTP